MEQYVIDPLIYYETIRKALTNFRAKHIFIRYMGSAGGKIIINECLDGKIININKTTDGLLILIDERERFLYKIYKEGLANWAIAYFRKIGLYLSIGPNFPDEALPPVKETILRSANHSFLMEITFEGKIPLRVLSLPTKERSCYFWEIDC